MKIGFNLIVVGSRGNSYVSIFKAMVVVFARLYKRGSYLFNYLIYCLVLFQKLILRVGYVEGEWLSYIDKSTFLCYTSKEVSERLQIGRGCLVVRVRPKLKTNTLIKQFLKSHVSGFSY